MNKLFLSIIALMVMSLRGMEQELSANVQEALFKAIKKKDAKLVEELIVKYKIDVNVPQIMYAGYKEQLITYNILMNCYEIVKVLLKYGANVDTESRYNEQKLLYLALHPGTSNPDSRVIELLLKSGAYNHKFAGGNLVNYCLRIGTAEHLLLLLKYGFSPNTRHTQTKSPSLCYIINLWKPHSIKKDRIEKILYLLEYGADPYKTSEYLSPADFFTLITDRHYILEALKNTHTNKVIADCVKSKNYWSLLREKLHTIRVLKKLEWHDKTRNFFTHPIEPIDLEAIKKEVRYELNLRMVVQDYKKFIEQKLSSVSAHKALQVITALQADDAIMSVRFPSFYNLHN